MIEKGIEKIENKIEYNQIVNRKFLKQTNKL